VSFPQAAAGLLIRHAAPTLQADVQIYNKILALIEDWSEAIELPAYRQELSDLRVTCLMHAKLLLFC
jgi:hypothetical protein